MYSVEFCVLPYNILVDASDIPNPTFADDVLMLMLLSLMKDTRRTDIEQNIFE